MFRYRDPQPQEVEHNLNLFNLGQSIWCLNTLFVPNISDFIELENRLKTTIVVIMMNGLSACIILEFNPPLKPSEYKW